MSKKQYLWISSAVAISVIWLWWSFAFPRSFFLVMLSDLSALVVLGAVAFFFVRAAWRSGHRIRFFWIFMAVGFGMWSVNQAAWCVYEIVLRRKMPDPFFGDIILFMHVVPLIAAVALIPHDSEKREALPFSTLNLLMLLVWWVFLYTFIVFPDEYLWVRLSVYNRNFDWLYLVENLVWVLSLALAARGARGQWKQLYLNLFGASALYTFASEAMNAAISRNAYYSGSPYDIPFFASLCWFLWTAAKTRKWTLEPDEKSQGKNRWVLVAPRLAMIAILSLPTMGLWVLLFNDSPMPLRRFRIMVMLVAMIVLGSFLSLKQYLLDHQLVDVLNETDRSLLNLQRLQTELVRKEKLAALGQLVAGAAQEIGHPLAAVLESSERFSHEPSLSAEQMSMAQKIGHHARRTRDLITDLLSFAQQNPGQKSQVALGAVVQRAVNMEAMRLESRNIRVEMNLAPDLPRILANSNQLADSCLQIISNAMDALEEMGGGKILVAGYADGGDVVLEFSDTGPGIQEPHKVFDPFYTTKPVGRGTGLGLSAVYGVVQDHQGQITCLNRPEGGAKFVLRFPVAPAAASASV